ncbi:MAG: TonB-dependent receptor plug domain-containing protein, partial [Vicinamibacterales bacterium]
MSVPTTTIRLAVLNCLLGAATAAVAQAPPPPPVQAEVEQGGLEEIIVTANKRSENMQDVPIAITALTADEAGKIGVVNGQTLAQVIPGLQLNRQTNGSTPFLRGVGNPSTQAGTEPAVAMYVDDVYYGSSAAALSNYNSISRIEVLRGPQGTLFGRNATGGVISVYTKDPTPEPELDVSLGYGNYDTISGSLYATGGLGDNLSANIALYGEDQDDGWGTNFTTGNDAYTYHNYGGRIKLLWDISDATSVLFNADYDDYENQQAVFFRPAPGTQSSAPGGTSIPPPGLYDSFENLDPTAAVEMYGASAKIKHEFSFAEFVSISSYRWAEAKQQFAQDGSSFFRLNPLLIYDTDTWTQEFQLLSPADSRIAWVGGLFYLNDSSTVDPF